MKNVETNLNVVMTTIANFFIADILIIPDDAYSVFDPYMFLHCWWVPHWSQFDPHSTNALFFVRKCFSTSDGYPRYLPQIIFSSLTPTRRIIRISLRPTCTRHQQCSHRNNTGNELRTSYRQLAITIVQPRNIWENENGKCTNNSK